MQHTRLCLQSRAWTFSRWYTNLNTLILDFPDYRTMKNNGLFLTCYCPAWGILLQQLKCHASVSFVVWIISHFTKENNTMEKSRRQSEKTQTRLVYAWWLFLFCGEQKNLKDRGEWESGCLWFLKLYPLSCLQCQTVKLFPLTSKRCLVLYFSVLLNA